MTDIIYSADLDDKKVLAALQRIDKSIDRIARDADKHFQSIGKSASGSGVQMGAVAGVVASLTTAFIQLGQQAVAVLIDIGKQSVQTALEMDTLKARLFGIFNGSQEAADQAFNFIQTRSVALGIDLGELAGAFIPKTESLAQFERVAKIATALAASDPEQGAIGARIALIEALSGSFISLQKRFEIDKTDIADIKAAFDTEGPEGFIRVLEEVLAKSGKSFDDLKDTAQVTFNKVGEAARQVGGVIGVPIVEALKNAADELLSFLGTTTDGVFRFNDDIIVFADTIGRSIADVIDLISSIDLSGFDTQGLIDIADTIFRIINAVELAVGQFIGLVQTLDDSGSAGSEYAFLLSNIDDALVSLAGILALTKAAFEAASAGATPFIKRLEALAKFATGDIMGGAAASIEAFAADSTGSLIDVTAGQEAFNESILESAESFKLYQDAINGNATAQDKLRQKLDETANAGTSAADAILAAEAAERAAAEAAEELAGAQAKVNEALADAKQDFDRKNIDIQIAHERKLLDVQIEFAQKREDAARNNLQKLADIRLKNNQDIDDAAIDLGRKEEDIARKFSDERIDLEREQRQSRLDIETSYREKLQDIQKQSAFDLDEAERNRDAVGFLRILRQQQQQVSTAQTDRQREIDELRVQGERKKEELNIQRQRDIEEAHIANERKLEDLRLNLERQIEAQNTAYAQQLEDLAIGEQRKNEEATRARERDIEDAKLAYERKLADLQTALAAELALIEEFAAKKAAAEASAGTSKSTSPSSSKPGKPSKTGGSGAGFGSNPGTITGHAFGGLVNRGQAKVVGERGPELFTPSANGRIIPSNQLLLPSFAPKSVINNISKTNAPAVNFPVGDASLFNDPIFVAKLRNIMLSVIDGVS